ncbi:IS3 family transposase [Fictibacillus sp. FJAT-27399]|uniref:IS3 family transposase n=1 Tax=Fictibacillus sp. FJAT-27399 TaxID=1729689 RepID=UPI000784AB3C|nr:IS3 family transposase [Fictibacillus sp. FJAT-27399]
MKFEFIHSHRSEHTIVLMCRILGVSSSGYYLYVNRLRREETERELWKKKVDERIRFHFHDNLSAYGSPRIHLKLMEADQINVSSKTVANRMRALNLYATSPKKFIATTDSNHSKRTYRNHLNRKFNPEAPNKVWVTDITYLRTLEGPLYFNPILDLFGRKIISFALDDHMEHTLPLKALREAIRIRKPDKGWIHHSDRGSQYCSENYIKELKESKAKISMSKKATPYDNACAESFFPSMKKEYLHKFVFTTKAEAIAAVKVYVEFYNDKRMHSSLGYAIPNEYELAYKEAQNQDAKNRRSKSA